MPLAETNWQFWSLVAGLVYLAVKQWIDKTAVSAAAATAATAATAAKSMAERGIMEGHDRAEQNRVLSIKVDDVKDMVNGGLSSAKAEIVALKSTVLDLRAQLAAERGTGNK